jgi:hypothetical protein
MKSVAAIGLLFLAVVAAHGKDPARPPVNGLTVHEWGVFRVNEDVDFANAAVRADWDDLPAFAYGYIKGRLVPQHWGAVEDRDKPIIFFHADRPTQVRVRVNFPDGMAGVWFPATENPAVFANQKQPKVGGSLEWNLGIKQCPNGWQPKAPAPPEVANKHWVNRVRQVKSDELFAKYSPNHLDVERERFIFYDGLFPQGKWMKIAVEKDRVSLTSQVKHSVFDVTIVDRRGENVRVGRIAKMDAGETIKEVEFKEVAASSFASEAVETLVKQLVSAGLFEDEARSLVDLWKKDMFETPGVNAFYRIPQSEYQARMPLTVTPVGASPVLKEPAPPTVVRVGLIYHGHLEPDFAERILELVKQLDADTFTQRDAAMKKLVAIGPAALVEVKRLRERKGLSVEVRERIDTLVKKWDAREAFDH